ncbi:hypothetical protein FKM82_025191 [Ascaphus truei]
MLPFCTLFICLMYFAVFHKHNPPPISLIFFPHSAHVIFYLYGTTYSAAQYNVGGRTIRLYISTYNVKTNGNNKFTPSLRNFDMFTV